MIKYFLLLFSLILLSCSQAVNKDRATEEKPINKNASYNLNTEKLISDTTNKELRTYLDYKFSENYPYSLKVTSNYLYVADGLYIYRFNMSGKFLKKIKKPKLIPEFINFDVFDKDSHQSFFYVVSNGLITCFSERGDIIYDDVIGGDYVKVDDSGIAYTQYQTNDVIPNKIKIIQFDGTSNDYPLKTNFGTLNIEIIKSEIMFHASDSEFYTLPLDVSKEIKSFPVSNLDGNVYFLGVSSNKFILKTCDIDNEKDILHIYDENLHLIKKEVLNLDFKEIISKQRLDLDYLMDNPSAIVYSYYNNNIFYLRNTDKGTYISKI